VDHRAGPVTNGQRVVGELIGGGLGIDGRVAVVKLGQVGPAAKRQAAVVLGELVDAVTKLAGVVTRREIGFIDVAAVQRPVADGLRPGQRRFVGAMGLSSLVDGNYSHDQITRFLGKERYDQKTYWKTIKPTVRQVERADGVVLVDDTIEEKPYTD
jgi:hypothetical protein